MDDKVKKPDLQALRGSSLLAGSNAVYLEQIYETYLQNPDSVEPEWRSYFDTLPQVNGTVKDIPHSEIRNTFRQIARLHKPSKPTADSAQQSTVHEGKQVRVLQLIDAYRIRGHRKAQFDPLEKREIQDVRDLHLKYHGLSEADLDTVFDTGRMVAPDHATLREIIQLLEQNYCEAIGSEFMHLTETVEILWIQHNIEHHRCDPSLSATEKINILKRLTAAEGMERYLHTQYTGQKRFSLEGAEGLIPLLDEIIQRGGVYKVKELFIAMAHRGRLNVLINILGKTPSEIFMEFEGKSNQDTEGSGDVKYHQGFSSKIKTPGGQVQINLAFNPSHLEIVNPVVEGAVRARQQKYNDTEGKQIVPVLIHGDAAFAGQGVVMETLNMSQSRGYSTKGTVHIVINNQIGFTTSNQQDARSTLYCTDVAKMVNAPIFHVNGDDPEAITFITQLALDYRMLFQKDVVIDLVCYRRHGHSEADEPFATQPMMYKRIRETSSTRALYAQRLIDEGIITSDDAESFAESYHQTMSEGKIAAPNLIKQNASHSPYTEDWNPYYEKACHIHIDTAVSLDRVRTLSEKLGELPEKFELNTNVAKIVDNRRKMAAGALPIDWGFAEIMAYATLVTEGYGVRLSGQDCGRGTFFHRHAVLVNQNDGEPYVPLRNLEKNQGNFLVINSLLSEEAVLAFEYGYSITDPKTLTIWEAQFGDFANNAQVVIDQFISAGEQKWNQLSGLVMLLPHGYEGQGPEHSSARLERYLQLCAERNLKICMPTTPAQIFHLLRQQMMLNCRKPLIVMSPKSLLRHRLAVSTLEDLSEGEFKPLIPETDNTDKKNITRVIMCSGKVYYDLYEKQVSENRTDIAIIRVEQLYPFPKQLLRNELKQYKNATEFLWCQEEPKNQGAWYASQHHMRKIIGDRGYLKYAGRPRSAAPAVGRANIHAEQLRTLLNEAMGTKK